MNKFLTAILLVLACSMAHGKGLPNKAVRKHPSNLQCAVRTLVRECAGCSLKGTKAVLETLQNRSRVEHKNYCQVVMAKGQWPWAATQKDWHFTEKELQRYFDVLQYPPVVGKAGWYFNTKRFPKGYGKLLLKVDGHFYYSK